MVEVDRVDLVEVEGEAPKPTKAPDLMAALEESLAAVKSEPLAEGSKKKPAARKTKSKKTSTTSKRSRAKTAK